MAATRETMEQGQQQMLVLLEEMRDLLLRIA